MSLPALAIFLVMMTIHSSVGWASESSEKPIIGEVFGSNPSTAALSDEAFRKGLHELGYIDGQNVTIVARYANGDAKQFPSLVQELIELHARVILVTITAVSAALRVTKTVPLVCPTMEDPVKTGLIAALAHPGGNLTGLYALGSETDAKRLELIREMVPNLKRVDLLFEANDPREMAYFDDLREDAARIGIRLQIYGVGTFQELEAALEAIDRERPQAIMLPTSPFILLHRAKILDRLSRRIPVISEGRQFAESGALLTYSANFLDMYRRSASYVDKILKGARPGDLPVEQPEKFELFVNLKTAKALHITIPRSILMRADEVIR